MRLETAQWRVPSVERAFDGWLEGAPTPDQRAARLAEVARERRDWVPSEEAWSQLRNLQSFIGRRVRVQFWDKIMFLLDDEGPHPILADCRGIVLLRDEGFLQPYMILNRIEELPNSLGYSPTNFLDREKISDLTLGPVAELYEITLFG
jgi:hypothetical protein